ncbi:hypothetical protein LTR65_007002 [Meristemomyces frigidus]
MNTVRRATPDSEAVGSSEDERPWPSSTSFGSLPRKEQGMPGLPGGIWSTQRKGSFKLSEAAHRNAETGIDSPPPPPPKKLALNYNDSSYKLLPPTPDKPSVNFSRPTPPTTAPHSPATNFSRPRLNFTPRAEDSTTLPQNSTARRVTFSEEVTVTHYGSSFASQSTHYSTSLQPPAVQTRLGEQYKADLHDRVRTNLETPLEEQDTEDIIGMLSELADVVTEKSIQNRGTMRFNDDPHGFEIPAIYKVPYVQIAPEELTEDDMRRERHRQASLSHPNPWATAAARGGDGPRPRKLLFIVSFKCSRVEVFFLLDNTGLDIHEGDIVIVEADRGQDLGTVQHANVTPDQARLYKRKYAEEQYKWLMMFSRNNEPSNVNPNAQLYGESSAMGTSRGNGNGSDNGNGNSNLLANAPSTMMGLPRDNFNTLKPKAIKRLANSHEIKMLGEKEGNEAKAKRTCQQKVAHLHLQMEILDAEWQWDFQKLIFYYYADHYINFKDLITDLYRIYKTRIWLSAVNPASFSQHAMGQSPSAIAPGAITGGHGGNDLSYSMAYGADPDPYGAVRPYRIGYETYTPNYPGIPGVANSFAPPGGSVGGGGGGLHQLAVASSAGSFQPVTDSNNALPSVQPGASQTGAAADYHFYYDRSGNNEHMMPFTPAETPVPASATTHNPASAIPFNPYANPYFNPNLMFGAPALNTAFMTPVSPWNTNTPIHPNAAGLGRQRELPQPIGTRPASNGSAEARLRNLTLSNRYESHASSSQHFTNNGNGNAGSS